MSIMKYILTCIFSIFLFFCKEEPDDDVDDLIKGFGHI